MNVVAPGRERIDGQSFSVVVNTMETITTRSGWKLRVEKRIGEQIEVALHREGEPRCLLHWGLRQPRQTEWQLPPPSMRSRPGATTFTARPARS